MIYDITPITFNQLDLLSAGHPQGGLQQTGHMAHLAVPDVEATDLIGVTKGMLFCAHGSRGTSSARQDAICEKHSKNIIMNLAYRRPKGRCSRCWLTAVRCCGCGAAALPRDVPPMSTPTRY